MKAFMITLIPPGGVQFSMLPHCHVRCHLNDQNADKLIAAFESSIQQIRNWKIGLVERAKAEELVKHQLPKTRIQLLEEELAALRASGQGNMPAPSDDEAKARAQTIVSGGFEPDDGSLTPPASL